MKHLLDEAGSNIVELKISEAEGRVIVVVNKIYFTPAVFTRKINIMRGDKGPPLLTKRIPGP